MHVTVRMFAGLASLIGKLAPLIRDDLVPRLKAVSGFKGHCTFADENGHLVSVTILGDAPSAVQADRRIEDWMIASLRGIAPCVSELTSGEALLHEVVKLQRDSRSAMSAIVRIYDGVGPKEEILPLVQQHVFLTITGAPGFRGYYAFLDERDTRRGVSVSLFDNRDHAMQANEWVVSVMRDQQIAPSPPNVLAGPVAVVAAT